MHKSIKFIALIAILVTGCQSSMSVLDQAATMVAQTVAAAPPTQTSTPTSTPFPASSPTPKMTSTPRLILTSTVEAYQVVSELDVWLGPNSAAPYREGHLAWQQINPVTIEMSGPQKDNGILETINENIIAKNFIFKSTVTWSASGVLICGIAFRAESNLATGMQYQFYFYRFSGLPAYKIDVYNLGRFKNTISDVKFSNGIDNNDGGINEFVLIVQNDNFSVFINGKQQGQFSDPNNQRDNGSIAFLGWQDSGKGSCTFNNSWLWVLP